MTYYYARDSASKTSFSEMTDVSIEHVAVSNSDYCRSQIRFNFVNKLKELGIVNSCDNIYLNVVYDTNWHR